MFSKISTWFIRLPGNNSELIITIQEPDNRDPGD